MGSDGLFDYFSDQEIVQCVRKLVKDEALAREEIGHELANEAKKKWPESSDDISCIVIFM
jgi:serine/threonine protein phosphatase PrpC